MFSHTSCFFPYFNDVTIWKFITTIIFYYRKIYPFIVIVVHVEFPIKSRILININWNLWGFFFLPSSSSFVEWKKGKFLLRVYFLKLKILCLKTNTKAKQFLNEHNPGKVLKQTIAINQMSKLTKVKYVDQLMYEINLRKINV